MRQRPDVGLIYLAALVRSTCVGLVGVVLAIHLSERGMSIAALGLLIGVGLAGSATATVVVGLRGDRFGRAGLCRHARSTAWEAASSAPH